MKKILFFMVAILPMILFTACSSDDEGLDNGTKYLSEIVVKEHEKKFGEISEYGELYEQYKYNQDGTIAEKTTNYYVNAVDSRIDYTYKYTYDNQGRLIERNDYELTLFEKKYKYEYNSIDSVSRMMVYDEDGDLNEDWTFEYDNQRRLIKTIEKIFGLAMTLDISANTHTKTIRFMWLSIAQKMKRCSEDIFMNMILKVIFCKKRILVEIQTKNQ